MKIQIESPCFQCGTILAADIELENAEYEYVLCDVCKDRGIQISFFSNVLAVDEYVSYK